MLHVRMVSAWMDGRQTIQIVYERIQYQRIQRFENDIDGSQLRGGFQLGPVGARIGYQQYRRIPQFLLLPEKRHDGAYRRVELGDAQDDQIGLQDRSALNNVLPVVDGEKSNSPELNTGIAAFRTVNSSSIRIIVMTGSSSCPPSWSYPCPVI